jgi:hypothetical protein
LPPFVEEVSDGVREVQGLNGVSSLVVSNDDVFATGENDDSLVAFKRGNEGRLRFTQRFKNRSGGIQKLENPNSIAISSDGQWVYVRSRGEGTVPGVAVNTYTDNDDNLIITVDLEDEDGVYENIGCIDLQINNVAPFLPELSLNRAR